MKRLNKIPFAEIIIDQCNTLEHVDNISKELRNNCYCPICGEKLILKHGEVNKKHLAHYPSSTCKIARGLELSKENKMVHKLYKRWIEEYYLNNKIYISYRDNFRIEDKFKEDSRLKYKDIYFDNKTSSVSSVIHTEEYSKEEYSPDIVFELENGDKVIFEVSTYSRVSGKQNKFYSEFEIPVFEVHIKEDLRSFEINNIYDGRSLMLEKKKNEINNSLRYKNANLKSNLTFAENISQLKSERRALSEKMANCSKHEYDALHEKWSELNREVYELVSLIPYIKC